MSRLNDRFVVLSCNLFYAVVQVNSTRLDGGNSRYRKTERTEALPEKIKPDPKSQKPVKGTTTIQYSTNDCKKTLL